MALSEGTRLDNVAPKLLTRLTGESLTHPAAGSAGVRTDSMNRDFQTRFTALLLILLTAAACVFAWINFQKEHEFKVPYDGVWWIEKDGRLVANRVEANGPGARAGIQNGDQLTAVGTHAIKSIAGLERQLYQVGIWSKATYSIVRQSVPVDLSVILVPAERSLYDWLRLIALIYLGIGIYVFCLTSFILYSFHYTGKLNEFDKIVLWGNVVAWMLQPALFLHFVLTFPEKREFVRKHPWSVSLVYLPGALLLAIHVLAVKYLPASERLRWNLDRLEMSYLALLFVSAAIVLWPKPRSETIPAAIATTFFNAPHSSTPTRSSEL